MNNSIAVITNSKECTRHIQYFATIENYLEANSYSIKADFNVDKVIICACGFHDFMFGKVHNTLTSLKAINFPEENIYLLGCLPRTHKESVSKVFDGVVIPFGEEHRLDALFNMEVPFHHVRPPNVFTLDQREHTDLYYIKIAQGCFRGCTFCVINKAKGKLQSESAAIVEAAFRRGVEKGYRHFFLMGEDTFAYGLDTGTSIIELTRSLIDIERDVRFSFGSLHIQWLERYAEDILELCKNEHIEHLHIGLQHVNDQVLKKMGRPAQFGSVYKKIEWIKAQYPDVIFSADVMVGFPGESETIFAELMDFFEHDCCFDQISHFGYSDVKGAASSGFDDKVDPLQVTYRWEQLRQLLGPRSYYNRSSRSIDQRNNRYREAFIATFEQDYAFCKNSSTI